MDRGQQALRESAALRVQALQQKLEQALARQGSGKAVLRE
jgi:hypothetical protein